MPESFKCFEIYLGGALYLQYPFPPPPPPLVGIYDFKNCQDFLDCQDPLFEIVEINSFD